MDVPDVTPDPPGLSWRAVLALLERLPQAGLSRSMGRVADVPLPTKVRRPVLRAFAKAFGIDLREAEKPVEEYGSINELFVRRLKEGARSWTDRPGLASPVDGVVGEVGRVDAGRLLQAKGRSYSAAEFLGDESEAERYHGGWFVTLYLSPRHYHRVHAPVGGTIAAARYLPGGLLPVNRAAVQKVEDLFARNERLLCFIDAPAGDARAGDGPAGDARAGGVRAGDARAGGVRAGDAPVGRVAVGAVGAYNVGRISAAFDRDWSGDADRPWVTNRKDEPPRERTYDPPLTVARGDEIMAFHLGSTVVLLTEPERFELEPGVRPGAEVALGSLLARP